MTKYYKEYTQNYFVEDEKLTNVLWEVLEKNHFTQLHIAETEKFAHVTKFFNGGNQIVFQWEKDILVPSHKVATYDQDPEMSAWEIWQEFQKNAKDFDFCVVNFANGDMVGHTGNMKACIQAIEKLDTIIWEMIDFCHLSDIHLCITADHGNCEEMWNSKNPKTSHTINQVPFWYIVNKKIIPTQKDGWLSNIASTLLDILWIKKPENMDKSLLISSNHS
jgi:2,3-bisphosphoglycerate-independent phosphoglycerate mutase